MKEVFYLGEPKVLSKCDFLKREELTIVRPESQKDNNGNCVHVNKCWYNLYVKMPDIYYSRICSDCNKLLERDGTTTMSHASFVKELAESTYDENEKNQLLASFEELNGYS